MSILNKYKHWGFKLVMLEDEYLDFVLSKDGTPSLSVGPYMTDRCLSAYIDFGNDKCYDEYTISVKGKTNTYTGVCSYSNYVWDGSVNSGVTLNDIGFTGIDNGKIYFGGFDHVTNAEFYKILTDSKLELQEGDMKLHMHGVTGNTGLHSYEMERDESGKFYKLHGGFFQGFYKLHGFDYQILPQYIENAWHAEIVLRPMDYDLKDDTLNKIYPDNSGIFFYMGTRAEDKFVQMYNADLSKYPEREQPERIYCDTFADGYLADWDYYEGPISNPCDVAKQEVKEYNKKKAYWYYKFLYEHEFRDYTQCDCYYCGCGESKDKKEEEKETTDDCCASYFTTDIVISGDTLTTSNGKPLSDSGYYEIKTDNKFLTFNRTKYGFTTSNWDEDTVVILTGSTAEFHTGNLFLLMNRTKSGYTTETIDQYYSSLASKQFDFTKDLFGNSFAMKYNADGSISYKYLVKICDKDKDKYKDDLTEYDDKIQILSETSYPGIVTPGVWNTINIKFVILNGIVDKCGVPYGQRKMKIFVYVNGYLKFISKELPEFNFRELDTAAEKQEGVPFNISVGGGTQGLCDSIWVDYGRAFEKILPIERDFAGTFVGDIKSFRFYTCPLEYTEIKNNYLYEIKRA